MGEAREALSRILVGFRRDGLDARPVFFGSRRQAEAVIIPIRLFEEMAPFIAVLEGPNEPHNEPTTYKGLTGMAALKPYQQDLYAAVRADNHQRSTQACAYSSGFQAEARCLD